MSKELCSYCGHTKYRSYKNMEWKWVCKCNKCGAIGPPMDTKIEAIEARNRRCVCDDHQFCCNTCDKKCGIELIESEGEE